MNEKTEERRPKEDLTGRIFGRWTVVKWGEYRGTKTYWWCKCNCKKRTSKLVCKCHLVNGDSTSCGCVRNEAVNKLWQNPKFRENHANGCRRRSQSLEWKTNHAEAVKKFTQDPESQRKKAEAMRALAKDPAWKENHAKAMRALAKDPTWRKKNAESVKKTTQDPEWQRKNAEALEKIHQSPEWRINVVRGAKKRSQDPKWQKNHSESMKKVFQDPKWQKNVAEAIRTTITAKWEDPDFRLMMECISIGKSKAQRTAEAADRRAALEALAASEPITPPS